MTRLIIFDYGRTLYNPDTRNLFNDAVEVVGKLAQNYKLAIVSVSAKEDEINRINLLKAHGILHHFKSILFTYDPEQKSDLHEQTLTKCNISPADVAIIDDYVIRGISWGNRVGSTTVWF